ncbi:hypothetical protein AUP68_13134 [Ilyonectria robusta]
MIEQRATALESQLDAQRSSSSGNANATSNGGAPGGGRGQLVVQFFEKRRRKAWLSRGDEEVCWECWTIKVTVAEPRTESGAYNPEIRPLCSFASNSIGMRRPPTPAILITTIQPECPSITQAGPNTNYGHHRKSKGSPRYGTNPPDYRHEDCHIRQHPQRPHTPDYHTRHQPVPLQDQSRPKGDELGHPHAHLLVAKAAAAHTWLTDLTNLSDLVKSNPYDEWIGVLSRMSTDEREKPQPLPRKLLSHWKDTLHTLHTANDLGGTQSS